MERNIKIVQDISLLYEVSLAIGTSLSFQENCKSFIRVLLTRKKLAYGAVWLKEKGLGLRDDYWDLKYSYPKGHIEELHEQRGAAFDKMFEKQDFRIIYPEDTQWSALAHESNLQHGAYIFFRLPDLGLIQLFASSKKLFTEEDGVKLTKVIHKFAVILSGCMAHEKLKSEISEKNRYQNALAESQQKYRLMIDSLAEGITLTDLEGRITFINKQMSILTGYTLEEVKGKMPYEVFSFPELAPLEKENIELRKRNISNTYTILHRRKDNSTWMGQVKASPYKDKDGKIIGSMGAVVDVTDKHQAEKRLLESEEKFRKVLFNALDAVVIIDNEYKVIEWNHQAEKIFKYPAEFAKDKNFIKLLFGVKSNQVTVHNYLEQSHTHSLSDRIEVAVKDSFEREFLIELSAISIQVNEQQMWSVFMRDITKRKQNERALILAKQKAEQARLAEQQFLANMSHEIRTPMNSVIGMAHLLAETPLRSIQKEYLQSLSFSAESLLGILNDILDLSKIEAGEINFENRPFDLLVLCNALIKSFQLKEKPIDLVLNYDHRLSNRIIGDSTRLNQILNNLISNAYKFTKEGRVELKIKVVEQKDEIAKIAFSVIDTGIGIPKERIADIFKNFKQADDSITRQFGGTGLGLTIVQQLVNLQGGEVTVESEVGRGSIFSFELSFEQETQPEILEEETHSFSEKEVFCLNNGRFLVVEDNLMNQRLIKAVFSNWSCNLDIAANGLEALEKTKSEEYSLILMDLHMPEMDGFEATEIIRSDPQNPNQNKPIIALTATVLQKDMDKAKASGLNDFLPKPFKPDQLKKTLLHWLSCCDTTVNSESVRTETEVVKLYDLSSLRKISRSNDRFLVEMIQIFLDTVPSQLSHLNQHASSKDWNDVALIAHTIKSNFASMGMKPQVDLCKRIEEMVRTSEVVDEVLLRRLIKALNENTQKTYQLLEKEIHASVSV